VILFKKLVKSLPLQLLAAIGIALLVEPLLSGPVLSFFYTLSCLFKDLLIMVIPFVVFGYLTTSIVSFDKKSLWMVLSIFGLVILSNGLSVWIAYGLGRTLLPLFSFPPLTNLDAPQGGLQVLWTLPWESPLTAGSALILALILGFVAILFDIHPIRKVARHIRDDATRVLRVAFIPLLPLYVFGFMLRLQHDGMFGLLVQGYGKVFALSMGATFSYILFLYGIAARFRWVPFKRMVEHMLPSGITAFTTMSSAATLPVTLTCVEKSLGRREYADFVVPLTANNHLIGDGFNIALASLALLWMTDHPLPGIADYGIFVVYYCIAKFSTAGVPGGAALVILPIVQTYLGLSPGLASLLTTLLVLQDPLITMVNVMGNGVFATLTARLFHVEKLPKGHT
jgi:Na+/H+-dicarboxylate symporter